MGHGGIGGRQKELFKSEHGWVWDLWPFCRNDQQFWVFTWKRVPYTPQAPTRYVV